MIQNDNIQISCRVIVALTRHDNNIEVNDFIESINLLDRDLENSWKISKNYNNV